MGVNNYRFNCMPQLKCCQSKCNYLFHLSICSLSVPSCLSVTEELLQCTSSAASGRVSVSFVEGVSIKLELRAAKLYLSVSQHLPIYVIHSLI